MQRDDAERVSRQMQFASLRSIPCDGEHSSEAIERPHAPAMDGGGGGLGITTGLKSLALRFQRRPEFEVVEQFAVEDDDRRPTVGTARSMPNDGLPAMNGIHDRESPVADPGGGIVPLAGIVRPTMRHHIPEPSPTGRIERGRVSTAREDADDAAHE